MNRTFLLCLSLFLLSLPGCQRCGPCGEEGRVLASPAPVVAQRIVKTELYFGLSKPDGVVSEAEWQQFLDQQITPVFKDGLTVLDASGQWSSDGKIIKEKSKVLVVLHPASAEIDAQIKALIAKYKAAFQQQSVLRTTTAVDVSFE